MTKLSNRKHIFGVGPRVKEQAAPATPPAGFVEVYAKADGYLYSKDDAGVEIQVGNVWPKLAPNGTAANPPYGFTNDVDSGMRLAGVGDLRITVGAQDRIVATDDGTNGGVLLGARGTGRVQALGPGGSVRLQVNDNEVRSERAFHTWNGSPSACAFASYNGVNTGMWFGGVSGDLRLASNGQEVLSAYDDGTNTNSVIHGRGSGRAKLAHAGTEKIGAGSASVDLTVPLVFAQAAAPSTPAAGTIIEYGKTDDHLYTKNDAGVESRVSNFVVCTSSTRPAAPVDGMQIYETDTFKTYFYISAKSGWFPPWATAWGTIASSVKSTNSSNYTASGDSDFTVSGVALRSDRNYAINLHTEFNLSAAGVWLGDFQVDGTYVGRAFNINATAALGNTLDTRVMYQPSSTTSSTVKIVLIEYSGSATFTLQVAAATGVRAMWIEDIGPR